MIAKSKAQLSGPETRRENGRGSRDCKGDLYSVQNVHAAEGKLIGDLGTGIALERTGIMFRSSMAHYFQWTGSGGAASQAASCTGSDIGQGWALLAGLERVEGHRGRSGNVA